MRRPSANEMFHNNGDNHGKTTPKNLHPCFSIDRVSTKIGSPSRESEFAHFVLSCESRSGPEHAQKVEECTFRATGKKRKRESQCTQELLGGRRSFIEDVTLIKSAIAEKQSVGSGTSDATKTVDTTRDIRSWGASADPKHGARQIRSTTADDNQTTCRQDELTSGSEGRASDDSDNLNGPEIILSGRCYHTVAEDAIQVPDVTCPRSPQHEDPRPDCSTDRTGSPNHPSGIFPAGACAEVLSETLLVQQSKPDLHAQIASQHSTDTPVCTRAANVSATTGLLKDDKTSNKSSSLANGAISSITGRVPINTDDRAVLFEFEDFDPFAETEEVANLCRSVRRLEPLITAGVKRAVLPSIAPIKDLQDRPSKQIQHRPWLKAAERRAARKMANVNTLEAKERCVHAEFSYLEILAIKKCLQDGPRTGLAARLERDLPIIAPDREIEDVLNFVAEYELLTSPDELPVDKLCTNVYSLHLQAETEREWLHRQHTVSFEPRLIAYRELGCSPNPYRKRAIGREAVLPGLLKADKIFRGTSGDVNAVSFSPSGEDFIVGSVATNDEYNRSGNLVMFKNDMAHGTTKCHVLDAKNLARDNYPSISCLDYVREGQYFIIGGTDETLKVYSANGRLLHDKSRKSRLGTYEITTSSKHQSLAFTCHSSGHLDVHTFRSDGVSNTYGIHHHRTLAPATAVFHNDLDQLIVGYQSDGRRLVAGQASIVDVTNMSVVQSIKGEESYAHICAGGSGLWAAGTNSPGKGIVKIFDARSDRAEVINFTNDQEDINEVAMCENLVTSVATDGTCYVWDIRNSSSTEPLHILRHGAPIQATGTEDVCGITGSCFFSYSRFVTGGSDGVVKLWDLGLAEPWIKDMVQVVSPITRLAVSKDKDRMLVGENRGDVHLWSLRGDGVEEQLIEEPL